MNGLNDFGSMAKQIVESCLILAAPKTRCSPQFLRDSFGVWLWPQYNFLLSYSFIRKSHSQAFLFLGGQRIELEATRPNYGGLRWWFTCPRCKRRAGRLYLPKDERSFLCRLCHDLSYESAQSSRASYYQLFKSFGVSSRAVREEIREAWNARRAADLVGYPRML